jgi:hypothetical protein
MFLDTTSSLADVEIDTEGRELSRSTTKLTSHSLVRSRPIVAG